MPKLFSFYSDVRGQKGIKNSSFDYPAAVEIKKAEEKAETKAVLSTAGKKRGLKKAGTGMLKDNKSTNSLAAESKASNTGAAAMDVDGEEKKDDKEKTDEEKKEEEEKKELPDLNKLANPSRVTNSQEKYIKFDVPPKLEHEDTRYIPILENFRKSGFLLLRDLKPDEAEEFVEAVKELKSEEEKKKEEAETEPEPPAPFEWTLEKDDKL